MASTSGLVVAAGCAGIGLIGPNSKITTICGNRIFMAVPVKDVRRVHFGERAQIFNGPPFCQPQSGTSAILFEPLNLLCRINFWQALALAVVQVDELLGLGVVADDVKPAHRLLFCGGKGMTRRPEIFAGGGVLGPQAVAGEIFQFLRVFDQDIHGRAG